jgi:hypothetical protein
MFIRSQDKKIVLKLSEIHYEQQGILHVLKSGGFKMGEYRSEKEALNQLERITTLLYNDKNIYGITIVYENKKRPSQKRSTARARPVQYAKTPPTTARWEWKRLFYEYSGLNRVCRHGMLQTASSPAAGGCRQAAASSMQPVHRL